MMVGSSTYSIWFGAEGCLQISRQTDWDVLLQRKRDRVHAVDLYDLGRNIRPAGRA